MDQIPESIKRILKEAKDLLEDGSKESAHEARDLLLDNPDAGEVPLYHLMLAKSAKECGEPEAGLIHLEKALELNPENITAIIILAEAKLRKEKKSDARELLLKGSVLSGIGVEQKIKIGQLLIKADAKNEALEFLRIAQESSPNVSKLRGAYAKILKIVGETEQYENESNQAIETQGLNDSVSERMDLARHYLNAREYGKVLGILSPLQSITEGLEDKKVKDSIHLMLAHCHIKFGNQDRAREIMSKVSKLDSLKSNYLWCEIQHAEGDLENAHRSAMAVKHMASQKVEKKEKKARMLLEAGSVNNEAGKKVQLIQEKLSNVRSKGVGKVMNIPLELNAESIEGFLNESELEVMVGSSAEKG